MRIIQGGTSAAVPGWRPKENRKGLVRSMQKSIDVLRRAGRLALRILRSRLTAVSALAAACAMMVTYVTVHMRAVTVVDGDTSRVVMTLSRTPVAVLEDAGVALGGHDVMNVSLDEGLIEISRAFPVSVTVDGMTAILQMTSGTVGDALQLAGVRLGAFDKVNAGLEDAVAPGTSLLVERVKYNEYTKTEPVDYKTTVKYSNSLDRGQSKIIQSGCKGEKTLVYRDCLVDGKVAETILVSESVTTEPVDQIKLVGVGGNMPMSPLPDSVELDGDGIPVHYKQVLTGSAAAYTWYNTPEGQTTSTGRKPQVGNVAVDPRIIPYGSELFIVSADGKYVYGYGIACDTGGSVRKGIIIADLFMDTVEECRIFGRRDIVIYVLE